MLGSFAHTNACEWAGRKSYRSRGVWDRWLGAGQPTPTCMSDTCLRPCTYPRTYARTHRHARTHAYTHTRQCRDKTCESAASEPLLSSSGTGSAGLGSSSSSSSSPRRSTIWDMATPLRPASSWLARAEPPGGVGETLGGLVGGDVGALLEWVRPCPSRTACVRAPPDVGLRTALEAPRRAHAVPRGRMQQCATCANARATGHAGRGGACRARARRNYIPRVCVASRSSRPSSNSCSARNPPVLALYRPCCAASSAATPRVHAWYSSPKQSGFWAFR